MNNTRVVLPVNHLPTRAPITSSVVLYIALDLYYAPEWLWVIAWVFMGLLWVGFLLLFFQQKPKALEGYGDTKTRRQSRCSVPYPREQEGNDCD